MYAAFRRNYNLKVHTARFHNVFGPEGTWTGGKEKAPAALCRKVAESQAHNNIEVWGDGLQTRSFLYIDDCIDAVRMLMKSDCYEILNIGSEEMISINNLAKMIINISAKPLKIKNIEGPIGVRGRNSDNDLIRKYLGWQPKFNLQQGMEITYRWIEKQVLEMEKVTL
jgi:nucleoside-diphosphate-sugar epimerase